MSVLPIVERELRVASRRPGTYWVRLALALVGLTIAALIFFITLGMPASLMGRTIFEWLAGLLLLYGLAYGRRSTADCLSQERREGTLGLLFLTDLKGHDVVLGKLVASSLNGFYGLLAVFPILALPMLLGGITNAELWRMVLVLVNTFLFSLAVGMLGSALARDFKQAMAANFLLLLLFVGGPPACMGLVENFTPARLVIPQLLLPCPPYAFYLCSDVHYQAAPTQFWGSVGLTLGLSGLLIWLASLIVPRSWQDHAAAPAPKRRWRQFWRAWNYGSPAGQGPFRARLLDVNAFYWLAARARRKPVHVWTFMGCLAGWWCIGWLASGRLWLDPVVAVLTALLLNGALKVWVTIEAGQQLAEDKATGGLELLLSTSLTPQGIVHGQWLALRRQFLKPLLVTLALEIFLLEVWILPSRDVLPGPAWVAGMAMLVADLVALAWVGMSRALLARSHNNATIGTLLRLLVLPWLGFGAVLAGGQTWVWLTRGGDWNPSWQFRLALWAGLGLAADLVFSLLAWRQLHYRFRQSALRRFDFPHVRAVLPARPAEQPRQASPRPAPAGSLRRWVFHPARLLSGGLALLVIASLFLWLRPSSHDPPPLLVSLTHTNGPMRVFAGIGGALFILPDGSLWRWGLAGGPERAAVPCQLGTNRDWVEAVAAPSHTLARQADGTLWECGVRFGGGGLRQVGTNHDWAAIAGSRSHSVALRRDGTLWAWGENFMGQLGIPAAALPGGSATVAVAGWPRPAATFVPEPIQLGTNEDWAAVFATWSGTLALRTDGSAWAWGSVYLFATRTASPLRLPAPTQICLETNWAGVAPGVFPMLLSRSGDLWDLFYGAPGPGVPINAVGRLDASNVSPGRVAYAYTGQPRLFVLRNDGSLWEKAFAYGGLPITVSDPSWHRVGKRTDWVALWSGGATAFGLTADDTLWTWGVDEGKEPSPDLATRLKDIQRQFQGMLGSARGATPFRGGAAVPAVQKQPRPLLRLDGP
ncbi:MAG TPA: ABC transporter permease subunit [Verrucomicrobiae bacterium]|nr:ABC transporter permease subunit [Verrucomicrobiae bacterium]